MVNFAWDKAKPMMFWCEACLSEQPVLAGLNVRECVGMPSDVTIIDVLHLAQKVEASLKEKSQIAPICKGCWIEEARQIYAS
jgi:hypothetical protein